MPECKALLSLGVLGFFEYKSRFAQASTAASSFPLCPLFTITSSLKCTSPCKTSRLASKFSYNMHFSLSVISSHKLNKHFIVPSLCGSHCCLRQAYDSKTGKYEPEIKAWRQEAHTSESLMDRSFCKVKQDLREGHGVLAEQAVSKFA